MLKEYGETKSKDEGEKKEPRDTEGKKSIDFARKIDFNDNFKISLDKSDIKLMRKSGMNDGEKMVSED